VLQFAVARLNQKNYESSKMSTSGNSSSSTPGGIGLPTSGDIDSSSNADDIVISYSG
jgi:hypothetical protein